MSFSVYLDVATRRLEGGLVLVGGAPARVIRLTAAGRDLVDRWQAGQPVPASGAGRRLADHLVDAGLAHRLSPVPAHGRALAPSDVTVVVPVRDRTVGLERTLGRLGPVGAVVVVDDGSSPPDARATAATVAALDASGEAGPLGARLIRHESARGPAAARNAGWRSAATAAVAFLDADCEPETGWLERLLPHLADDAAGAVAPRVVSPASGPARGVGRARTCRPALASRAATGQVLQSVRHYLAAYETVASPLDLGGDAALVGPRSRVPYVPSAALVVRRTALSGVGGFDESLTVGEDVDLIWRLAQSGWTVQYAPAVRITHPPRAGLGAWLGQRFRYGCSAAPLSRRHPGALPPVAVSPWSWASWGLVAGGRYAAGAGVAGLTTALLARRLHRLRHPWITAARLTGASQLAAGRQLAVALTRAWWPASLLVGVVSRRAGRRLAAGVLLQSVAEWPGWRALAAGGGRVDSAAVGPVPWMALRLADNLAYGAGLWWGCLAERHLAALVPHRPALSPRPPRGQPPTGR